MISTAQQIDIREKTEVTTAVFPLRALLATLALALFGRILLLASGSVSFHSDEAVIALMARHILEGARPVFFYGQAYMGSLDAFLVSLGFATLGESVLTIRIVQAVLYMGVVASGFAAAWRLSGRPVVATVTGLTLAIMPVLLATYTTATLGGYNETLLFGNLLLLLAYDVTHAHTRSLPRWLLLGIIAGLGWWTNGLIVAYGLPVALLVLYRTLRPIDAAAAPGLLLRLVPLVVALGGFFVGSAPWWLFNLQHDWQALAFYVARTDEGQFAGNSVPSLPLEQRVLGLLFLGLPTLIGLRFPWQPSFFAPLIGAVVLFIYGVAFVRLLRGARTPQGTHPLKPGARALVVGMVGLFCLLFFVSKFSIDPTGRYFLPLAVPFGIVLGTLIDTLPARTRLLRTPRQRQMGQAALVGIVLVYFAAGQISAASVEPGLTTQFNLDSHIPNTYDEELIAFLDEQNLYAGYSTYWVTFRLAFLSDERMQYSSALPYKPSLEYTPADERYPAYKATADQTERIAYITANVAEVRASLERIFDEGGIRYDKTVIGPYHIYYNFDPAPPRPPLPLDE
jgi:hypothetical protein